MLFQRASFDYFSYACVSNPDIFDNFAISYEFRYPPLLLPHRRDVANKALEHNIKQRLAGEFTVVDAVLYFMHFVRDSFDSLVLRFTVKDLRKLQLVLRQFEMEPFSEINVCIAQVVDLKRVSAQVQSLCHKIVQTVYSAQ